MLDAKPTCDTVQATLMLSISPSVDGLISKDSALSEDTRRQQATKALVFILGIIDSPVSWNVLQ
jgi:hypothetical protein